MLLQLSRPTILLTATVAAVVASQTQAIAQASGTVSTARYDAARKAIVIPYTGAFPTYVTDSLGGPPRVYFDFNARAGFRGVPSASVSGHPSLKSWAMAARGGNQTRITLTFAKATRVIVLNDRSRNQIVLVPDVPGAAVSTPTPPSPRPKATAKPQPTTGGKTRTFTQTFGQTDFRYTVGPRPKGATKDQVNVSVGTSGVTDFHVTSEPERDYVSFSITVKGKPAPPAATPRPVATPRPMAPPSPLPTPAPLKTPEPLPTPELDAPEPLPTPALAEPSPAPTPIPTPEVPTPEESPVVIEVPTAQPGTSVSLYGDYYLGLDEAAPTLGSQFSSLDTPAQGVALFTRFGSWGYLLDVRHLAYRITDDQTQNTTAHLRDEYEAHTGLAYRFEPFGVEQQIGVGVLARYMSNNNILASSDTPIGPPATPGILSAPAAAFFGPTLFGQLELPLFGPLGIQARGGVSPFMMGAMSAPAEGLTGMMGYWAVPSVFLRFGGFEVSGGYALHSYTASGYDYLRMGPQGRVELRF